LILGIVSTVILLSIEEFRTTITDSITDFMKSFDDFPSGKLLFIFILIIAIPFLLYLFFIIAIPFLIGLLGLKAAFPLMRYIATTYTKNEDKTKVLDKDFMTPFSLLRWIINHIRNKKGKGTKILK
jgi:hypothetical protein